MRRYGGTLTTAKAAALLGLTARTVRLHCKNGLIHAEKYGRDWLIDPDDVARFVQERQKPGRPKKEQDHARAID